MLDAHEGSPAFCASFYYSCIAIIYSFVPCLFLRYVRVFFFEKTPGVPLIINIFGVYYLSFFFSSSLSIPCNRFKFYLFSLFLPLFSSISLLGLQPISVVLINSNIGLTAFSILNNLFFSLSLCILGHFMFVWIKLLYNILFYLAYCLYSNNRWSILYLAILYY